jgi:hypothetical protein
MSHIEPSEQTVNANNESEKSLFSTVNWLIAPPSQFQMEGGKEMLKGFIVGAFLKFRKALALEEDGSKISEHKLPSVLMKTPSGFKLTVDSTLSENTLHPFTLEGAGEITHADGHLPLLILIALEQRFQNEMVTAEPLVTFCDEQGNTVSYKKFSSLEQLLQKMGFDYDDVRNDGVKLGLTTEKINLSEIQSDIEDCYF